MDSLTLVDRFAKIVDADLHSSFYLYSEVVLSGHRPAPDGPRRPQAFSLDTSRRVTAQRYPRPWPWSSTAIDTGEASEGLSVVGMRTDASPAKALAPCHKRPVPVSPSIQPTLKKIKLPETDLTLPSSTLTPRSAPAVAVVATPPLSLVPPPADPIHGAVLDAVVRALSAGTCAALLIDALPALTSSFSDARRWTAVVGCDFGWEFRRMARGDDDEYFQVTGEFSAEAVAGLQRCIDGVKKGRLRRQALTPTFEFFFSARGLKVFEMFIKRWVDAQAGTQCIFSFCALWLRAAKLYEKCYNTPPVFGRACGDARWSAAEKVKMLRGVRDRLPRGIGAKLEPVKLFLEEIFFVVLEAQEKLAGRDESVDGKAEEAKGNVKAKTLPSPKRARPALVGKVRKVTSDRPFAAPQLSRDWGKVPRKSPILAPGAS